MRYRRAFKLEGVSQVESTVRIASFNSLHFKLLIDALAQIFRLWQLQNLIYFLTL